MWICKGCKQTAIDSDYLQYQLNVLNRVHLKDSDQRIWFVCGHCKSQGHAKCIFSTSDDKIAKLDQYTCCHSKALQRILNKRFLYGDKLRELDGSASN